MDNLQKQQFRRKKAVAIQYDESEIAPKVIAKGAGVVAEKILEIGNASDVAIHQDELLVEDLARLDIGMHIPPELYLAVAQVLVFINELDGQEGRDEKRENKVIGGSYG